MTNPDRSGDYVLVLLRRYPVRGAKQCRTASEAIRAAGWECAPIEHWDGFEWTAPGEVLHATPRPVGRPPLAADVARVALKLDANDHARWTAAAARESLSLSAWIREACDLAVARGSTR